jgi:hypothetical protein
MYTAAMKLLEKVEEAASLYWIELIVMESV